MANAKTKEKPASTQASKKTDGLAELVQAQKNDGLLEYALRFSMHDGKPPVIVAGNVPIHGANNPDMAVHNIKLIETLLRDNIEGAFFKLARARLEAQTYNESNTGSSNGENTGKHG